MIARNSDDSVFVVMGRIVGRLNNTLETSRTKAILAQLRNSIGRDFSQTVDVWGEVFSEMPEEFLSKTGKPTKEENAILTALQFYAFHQQGKKESVNMQKIDKENIDSKMKYSNIGDSLRELRKSDDSRAIDRRFNTMITAATFEELKIHLRHLISLFKARSSSKINYAKLAEDLFWFQHGNKEYIRLRWGQSYYRNIKKNKEKNDEE